VNSFNPLDIVLLSFTGCLSMTALKTKVGLHDHQQEIFCKTYLLVVKASFQMIQGANEPSVILSAET
jgi:hypothetical protein